MYEIIETAERGKVMIATQDMLPGTEVIQEEAVMCMPQSYIDQYKGFVFPESLQQIIAPYSYFTKHLNSIQQQQYLELYGPTDGIKGKGFRHIAKNIRRDASFGGGETLSELEQEQFAKIVSIYRHNAFGNEQMNNVVFYNVTRMSHSCIPNCDVNILSKSCIVRCITPIKSGEELTLEYNNSYSLKSTAFRRWRYLETKSFTCHCPRCCAAGDDTRQFNCFDPACEGRHYVCQPLSDNPISITDDVYTEDVSYTPPYMLPCNVCQRSPPQHYQADMLALETQLTTKYEEFEQRANQFQQPRIHSGPELLNLLHDIMKQKPPPWHSLTILYANLLYKVQNYYIFYLNLINFPDPNIPIVPIITLEHALEVEETILTYPNEHLYNTMNSVAIVNNFWGTPQRALDVYRKVLRMYALLNAREKRFVLGDKHTAELIKKLPQPEVANTHHCAFCHERPDKVAIKLSQCGACKQVVYCSRGCQKAHWPVHKQQCKKIVK